MRGVLLEVPASLLEERRRLGIDGRDELWKGVVHLVPPPSEPHQRLGGLFFVVMEPLAEQHGLVGSYETGLFRPGDHDDYRVPDQVYTRPEDRSHRGVEGRAVLVVEIRSPGDETYDKLDFYAELGVEQVLVLHPETRTAELYRGVDGRIVAVQADGRGRLRLAPFDVTLQTVDGPALRVVWPDGERTI